MKFFLALFFFLVPATIHAGGTKVDRIDKFKDLELEVVERPKVCDQKECQGCSDDRLTNKWSFVVDTSASTWGIFSKVRKAFISATSYPTDELEFNMYTFSGKGYERYRHWAWASQEEFEKADDWVNEKRIGVHSYGARAIRWAIMGWIPYYDKYGIYTGSGKYDTRKNLTIIVITDGGFTENIRTNDMTDIKAEIEKAQKWREEKGYPRAQIATIGIENLYYRANHKRTDKACQKDLRDVGITGRGGYYYLRRKRIKLR